VRRYTCDLLCLAVLALAVGWYYHDAVCGKGTFVSGDFVPQDIPNRHYFSEALRHGELPLWTPEMDCGWPMYAEGQAGLFYPLNWFLCLRPLPWFFSLSVVFHVFLGGAGTYLLARTLGTGRLGALLSGLCISFSPIFNAEEGCANFVCSAAWIPVVGALFKLAVGHRSRLYLLLGTSAFAMQFLAGHPYCTWYGLLVVLFIAFEECWTEPPFRRRMAYVLSRLAVWGVLAGGLCAIQMLPMMRLISESDRSEGISGEVIASGISPVAFRSVLSPSYFGSYRTETWYAHVQKDQLLFMGITAICLVPFGLLARPRRVTILLVLMGLFGVLASFEGDVTLLPKLLASAPPMNMFRHRASYIMLTVLATALIAGKGLHVLLHDTIGRHVADSAESRPRPGLRWSLLALVFAGGMAALAYHYSVKESFMPPESSYPPDPVILRRKLQLLLAGRTQDLHWLAVFWGLACLTIAGGLLGFIRGRLIAVLLIGQQLASVLFCGIPSPALIDFAFFERDPQVLQATVKNDPQGRTYSRWPSSSGDWSGAFKNTRLDNSAFQNNAELISYNLPLMHGLDFVGSIPGPLRIGRYDHLHAVLTATGNPLLLGLMSVKYVFAESDFPVRLPALKLVYDGQVRAYENQDFLPRVFLVGRIITASDALMARRIVTGRTLLPRLEAVVEDYDGPPLPSVAPAAEPGPIPN
jgi:hypothetical protein